MSEALIKFVVKFLEEKNIACSIFLPPFTSLANHDLGLRRSIMDLPDTTPIMQNESGIIDERAIYHMVDYYCCYYSLMYLPTGEYLLVGPWLPKNMDDIAFYQCMERLALPQIFWGQMRDYYFQVPVLENMYGVEALINHLGKTVYKDDNLPINYLDAEKMQEWEEYFGNYPRQIPKEHTLSMHMLEERYESENKLLDAVCRGNTALALNIAGDGFFLLFLSDCQTNL